MRSPGLSIIKYGIESVFVGVHFNFVENIKFNEFIMQTTYLEHWVYRGSPNFLKRWDNSDSSDFYFNPPELKGKTSEAIISIKPGIIVNQNWFEEKRENYAQLSIKLINQELSLKKVYDLYLYPIQNFLSLATNKNNHIIKLNAFSQHGYVLNGERNDEKTAIEILATFIRGEKLNFVHKMLFSLKDIENEFSLYLQKWLNINQEIKHICYLYFGTKYAEENMLGENTLLNLVQFLESYHRIKNNQIKDFSESHKNKLKEIYDKCPKEHLDWLKEKLVFSHEPNLKTRLNELMTLHQKAITPLVKDKNAFVTKIKDTRNYYTHYNQSLKDKAATGEELFRINQILSYTIQCCLLTELGCTSERCAEIMMRNNEYNYTIQAVKASNYQW